MKYAKFRFVSFKLDYGAGGTGIITFVDEMDEELLTEEAAISYIRNLNQSAKGWHYYLDPADAIPV